MMKVIETQVMKDEKMEVLEANCRHEEVSSWRVRPARAEEHTKVSELKCLWEPG